MIRTAITGTEICPQGYMHIFRNTPEFLISGIYMQDHDEYFFTESAGKTKNGTNTDHLIEISDALMVTSQAGDHFDLICSFLKKARHVLIIPDTSLSFMQVKALSEIAEEAGVVLHLHHNTFPDDIKQRIRAYIHRPEYMFIKSQVPGKKESCHPDIYKVLYRSIYLMFELHPVNISKYHINRLPVCAEEPSILDISVQFENGAAAHLFISSCYEVESEKLEIFGQGNMIYCESLKNKFTVLRTHSDETIEDCRDVTDLHLRHDEALIKFLHSVNMNNIDGNRFSNGIIAHEFASSIFKQLHPLPAENKIL